MPSTESMLLFRIRALWLAIPSRHVSLLHAVLEPTPVPLAPAHVPGIVSIRGEVLPLLDLAQFIEAGQEGEARRSTAFARLAVVSAGGMKVGVICHEVKGVQPLPLPKSKSAGVARGSRLEQIALGEVAEGDKVVVVLDAKAMLEATRVRS